MPLPTAPSTPWPPKVPGSEDRAEAAAWYTGDTAALTTVYGGPASGEQAQAKRGGRARFWSKASTAPESRQRIHLPAASDIAAASADLLFGDEPAFVIPEAHEERAKGEDGATLPPSQEASAAGKTEDRLRELLDLNGVANTLVEAAEFCAGLGDIYLRPVWDRTLVDHPMLSVVHADHASPEFRWGRLSAVTFWRTVLIDDAKGKAAVWRHLERHEPGRILHGLYIGTADTLGTRVDLSRHPDTAALIGPDGANDEGVVMLADKGITGLAVRHVRNALNRKHRGIPIGRSDTAGVESLMDSLDETWTSWMRDIRLGKARIVVPSEFLERSGRGQGAKFDLDAEVYSPLEMDPSNMNKAGITPVEFKIRCDEHAATASALFEAIARAAGYSPQTFGMQGDGNEQTATEIDAREDRSVRTTTRKRRYWQAAVEESLEMLLQVDATVFGSGVTPMRPRIEWSEPDSDTLKERAESLNQIALAKAASTETLVKILNPDWEQTQVDAEVAAILAEQNVQVTDPTGGFPA